MKDHKELYDKTNEHFKDKVRNAFRRGFFKVHILGLNPKGLAAANSHSPSLVMLQKK